MAKRLNPAAFNDWVYRIIDDYSHRIEVYYGGAGSGKSYGAMQKILLKAMNAKRRVLVIRKVGATLKDSVFALMRLLLAESGQLPGTRINRSDFEIELRNGSIFLFKGLDDPEKIKSITGITDIVIEEATELTPEDFMQLDLRLRPVEPNPQIFLMFNPVSKANWVYAHFFLSPPDNAVIINSTYHDNRFLTDEYKATLEHLKATSPAYYRIYALGEFATLDKLIFPLYTKRLISAEEVAAYPQWCGLDHGYNDPAALTWGRWDESGKRIFITGEYGRSEMLNDALYQVICDLGLSRARIVADSEDKKSNIELQRMGLRRLIPASKGPDSVINGIKWILTHELIVDERCARVIEELDNYTWVKDKKTGEYIDKPIDAFCHHMDAMRYGLEPLRAGKLGFAQTLSPKQINQGIRR